jgi:hypothetical protein
LPPSAAKKKKVNKTAVVHVNLHGAALLKHDVDFLSSWYHGEVVAACLCGSGGGATAVVPPPFPPAWCLPFDQLLHVAGVLGEPLPSKKQSTKVHPMPPVLRPAAAPCAVLAAGNGGQAPSPFDQLHASLQQYSDEEWMEVRTSYNGPDTKANGRKRRPLAPQH